VILRIKGDFLAKWIKDICTKWNSDKEFIPELLHVLIEDLIPSEKSFSVKIAICKTMTIFRILIQEYLGISRRMAS
jgi:hypothetical protein